MEKNSEQCMAIKFYFKASKNAMETFEMLKVAYSKSVLYFVGITRFRHVGSRLKTRREAADLAQQKWTITSLVS